VGERKGQFVGGYSATNLGEVIADLTSSLQEELQLNHQPNPEKICFLKKTFRQYRRI